VQNKKELHKKEKKSEVWLSDFTKPANLADFTKAETGPIWLVRFVRFYQACELIRFYQG
jgi:predicted DNA-binding helix-hairpin-helix protein